jgi:AraC-like DNA-binding protein
MEIKSVRKRCPTLDLIGVAAEIHNPGTRDAQAYHLHDMIEMVFVLEGDGVHYVDNDSYPFSPGALVIVHYNQTHAVQCRNMKIINIYYDTINSPLPAVPSEFLSILPGILPLHSAFQHKQNRVVYMNFSAPDEVKNILLSLHKEQKEKKPGYLQMMKRLSELFLAHCCREMIGKDSVSDEKIDVDPLQRQLSALRQYLDMNYSKNMNLNDLSRKFAISKSHLCRLFKTHTGKTIFEYIHQRRIEQAVALLAGTRKKIIEISSECGFNNASHFNRVFLKITGKKPSAYR